MTDGRRESPAVTVRSEDVEVRAERAVIEAVELRRELELACFLLSAPAAVDDRLRLPFTLADELRRRGVAAAADVIVLPCSSAARLDPRLGRVLVEVMAAEDGETGTGALAEGAEVGRWTATPALGASMEERRRGFSDSSTLSIADEAEGDDESAELGEVCEGGTGDRGDRGDEGGEGRMRPDVVGGTGSTSDAGSFFAAGAEVRSDAGGAVIATGAEIPEVLSAGAKVSGAAWASSTFGLASCAGDEGATLIGGATVVACWSSFSGASALVESSSSCVTGNGAAAVLAWSGTTFANSC